MKPSEYNASKMNYIEIVKKSGTVFENSLQKQKNEKNAGKTPFMSHDQLIKFFTVLSRLSKEVGLFENHIKKTTYINATPTMQKILNLFPNNTQVAAQTAAQTGANGAPAAQTGANGAPATGGAQGANGAPAAQ